MSCTLMYQPYAMSYSSSCERPSASSERQKLFKFPHIPSPPDSSHSGASSYSGHSSSASSTHIPTAALGNSNLSLSLSAHHSPGGRSSTSRRPLTPCASSGPSATITSSGVSHIPHQSHHGHHITHSHSNSSNSSSSRPSSSNHPSASATSHSHNPSGGGSELQHHGNSSAAATSSLTSTSHIHHEPHNNNNQPGPSGSTTSSGSGSGNSSGGTNRAQYLSANCVVYESYDGEAARVVDEHFSRALSAAYTSEKPSKSLPMTTRNFPPSFWNSAYQPPPKPLTSYGATGASDFYGSAMDYGSALPALAHHHNTDPWHYPLTSHHHHHQPYHHHHRAADLAYPPIASTSRFNPAQYGSFLFPGAAATSAAGRFAGIPGSSQCGVKGEAGGHWGAGGRYHPHESTWSDFHLADYSAAAAHYSSMTAGLDFESHYLQSS